VVAFDHRGGQMVRHLTSTAMGQAAKLEVTTRVNATRSELLIMVLCSYICPI